MTVAPIAVSIGEPAGIGPDIIVQTWHKRFELDVPPFVVVGDAGCLQARAEALGLAVESESLSSMSAAAFPAQRLPVLQIGTMLGEPGNPCDQDASHVIQSIRTATQLVLDGHASALVTAPIHKSLLYGAGFDHPGHTEFLASLCEAAGNQPYQPVMMLSGPGLRTVPVTIHHRLADVPRLVTKERITATCRIVDRDLRNRFGISRPRLAVAGLNPHAGERGALGREELTVIEPALAELRRSGLQIAGPLPADTLFHPGARSRYDVAICMYHDQALIPAKMLNFDDAVNVTLGLPIIRTSPDHGTAFDIAGSGQANPSSFIAALRLAAQMRQLDRVTGSDR